MIRFYDFTNDNKEGSVSIMNHTINYVGYNGKVYVSGFDIVKTIHTKLNMMGVFLKLDFKFIRSVHSILRNYKNTMLISRTDNSSLMFKMKELGSLRSIKKQAVFDTKYIDMREIFKLYVTNFDINSKEGYMKINDILFPSHYIMKQNTMTDHEQMVTYFIDRELNGYCVEHIPHISLL